MHVLAARVDPIVQIAARQRPVRAGVVVRSHELLAGVELVRDRGPISIGPGNVRRRPESQQLDRIRVARLGRNIVRDWRDRSATSGSGTGGPAVRFVASAPPPLLREEEKQLLAAWQRRSAERVPEVVVPEPRWCAVDFGSRVVMLRKNELAFSASLRRKSYALPENLLVPDFVTALTTPPPLRAHSAE